MERQLSMNGVTYGGLKAFELARNLPTAELIVLQVME
jgi:surfactin synthase thioesterase subunit